jgi:hypothetical protein
VQSAQFFRGGANIKDMVVGCAAKRVLLGELEDSCREKVAASNQAVPKLGGAGNFRLATRHDCRKGIKLFQLRLQAESFAFNFLPVVSGAAHALFKSFQSTILDGVEIG